VARSGTQFVAVGISDVLTSIDGITWTTRLSSGTSVTYTRVIWSGSQFVAVGGAGSGGSVVLTSSDGVTWNARSVPQTGYLLGITWTGTRFVAGAGGGHYLISPDGATWTVENMGVTAIINSLAWSGTELVAVGSGIWSAP
jgi:hypothetical protein